MASYKYGNSTNYFKESDNKFRNTSFTVQPGSSVSFNTVSKPGDADFFLYRFIITSGLSQYAPEQYRYNAFIKAVATEVYRDVNNDTFKRTVLLNCAVDIEDSVSCTSNIQIPSAGATLESVALVVTNSTNIPVVFSGLFLFPSYSAANAYSNNAIADLEDNETDEDDDTGTFADVFKTTIYQTKARDIPAITIQKRGQQEWYGKTSRFALTSIRYFNGATASHGTVFDMWGNKICSLGAAGGQLKKYTEYLYIIDQEAESINDISISDGNPGQIVYFNTMGLNGLYYKGTGDKVHYDLINGTSVYPDSDDNRDWSHYSVGYEYVHYLTTKDSGSSIISENFLNFDESTNYYIASNIINRYCIGLAISYQDENDASQIHNSSYRLGIYFFPVGFSDVLVSGADVEETWPTMINTKYGNLLMFINVGSEDDIGPADVFDGYTLSYAAFQAFETMSTKEKIAYVKTKITSVVNELITYTKVTKDNFLNSLSENVITDSSVYPLNDDI